MSMISREQAIKTHKLSAVFLKKQRAFLLMEALVAIAIFGIGSLGVLGLVGHVQETMIRVQNLLYEHHDDLLDDNHSVCLCETHSLLPPEHASSGLPTAKACDKQFACLCSLIHGKEHWRLIPL